MAEPKELCKAAPAITRGTLLGSFLGILPGGGALLASFASYTLEKKVGGKTPILRLVKATLPVLPVRNLPTTQAPDELHSDAHARHSCNATMALMIGALMIHNITPGPQVMSSNPTLFWGLVVSMWIGNLMLVILNLPLIGVWVQLLRVPYGLLYPMILTFCCIGVYSINNNPFDVYITIICGALGYLFAKLKCEPAPLILGFILGPMMEENLRRAMLLSRGDPSTFFTRPISLVLLMMAIFLLLLILLPSIKKGREVAFKED